MKFSNKKCFMKINNKKCNVLCLKCNFLVWFEMAGF